MAFIEGDVQKIVKDPVIREAALLEATSIHSALLRKLGVPRKDADSIEESLLHPETRRDARILISTVQEIQPAQKDILHTLFTAKLDAAKSQREAQKEADKKPLGMAATVVEFINRGSRSMVTRATQFQGLRP